MADNDLEAVRAQRLAQLQSQYVSFTSCFRMQTHKTDGRRKYFSFIYACVLFIEKGG